MPDAALSIQNLDKTYAPARKAPVHAVRNLAMDVARGEIIALLGSSGCGKTSTLRMIAGFEDVTSGAITLAGRRIEGLAPAQRRVAMAFEGYSLYPPLTVRENIAFALKSARLAPAEAARRVKAIADLVEIGPILDRYPSSISAGQQQRASLARALVREADLYLLDEPMGQLEPQLRTMLRGRLKNLLRERGLTAIFVTHDQTEANALADRVAVMEGGVLQQFASQRTLKEQPVNLFVATFIGEPPMNVFEAAVSRRKGDGLRFELGYGVSLDYPAGAFSPAVLAAIGTRDRLTLGIRPHQVRIGPATDGAAARVISNQWLGDQSHLAAQVVGRTLVVVSHGSIAARVGEDVGFAFPAGDLHLFDTATGAAIAHGREAA